MSDETEKRGPGRPPKAATVSMVILRDYWTKGDGSDDDRVRAGTVVEVSVDEAMAGLESGSMRRATDED
jgi:hypothetical protein